MFIKPRPYQQDIIDKTLETEKSTLIQLPTGGGKTIISKEITIGLINNFNKKILFIAPKIVLMDQTLETFKGLNPQKVHGPNNKFDNNHHILISTLQTASRRNSLSPDVIIIDEVHFGYEKKMLNKIMKNNPDARIIGLSATPYDENGYPFKGFDVIINDYDLTYMIKNKYLVPLRSFVLVKPDLSNVDIIAGDYELNQLSEAVSKNTVIMEIVSTSKPYIEQSLKTIVFAVDINHAELLAAAFRKIGFTSEALHSKSEENDSEVIERFKRGYIKVLVSVLKLTTGFDVPETDLAIIARPTKSQNLYKQMVGRVLRTVDFEKTGIDKKLAILLDCGNVIENLGKPLDPIIPKDELEKKVQKLKCKVCESENIKLKISDTNHFWECQDCGHKEDIENKNQYVCSNCEKKYTYENGEFELINHSLYLNCECGTETEISIATGEEEFKEVDSGIEIQIEDNDIKFLDELISLLLKEYKFIKKNNILKPENNYFIDNDYVFIDELFIKLNKNELYILLKENTEVDIGKTFNIEQNIPELLDCIDDEHHYQENYNQIIAFVLSLNDFFTKNNIDVKFFDRNIDIDQEELKNFNNKIIKYNINYGIDDYLPYNEAKEYVKSLNYNNKALWDHHIKYLDKYELPNNIPINPSEYYQNKGWINWNDWLGIDNEEIVTIKKTNTKVLDYLPFNDALAYVRNLNLENKNSWKQYLLSGKKPNNIPSNPHEFYAGKGWISTDHWIGKIKYLSFYKAKLFVHTLNLKSKDEWQAYIDLKMDIKPPYNMPLNPEEFYINDGWKSWADWLYKEKKISINKASNILKISIKELLTLLRKNRVDISFNEFDLNVFKKIRTQLKDNIEIEKQKSDTIPYEEAKSYAKALKLKNEKDWLNYYDKCYPYYSKPTDPKEIYQEDWIDWKDWLGITEKEELDLLLDKNQKPTQVKKKKTNTKVSDYLPFEEAREFARTLNLRTVNDWKEYCKGLMVDLPARPENIPSKPEQVYFRLGWKSYRDWLTTGYRSFKEAKEFVIKLGIKNVKDWNDYCKGELEGYAPKPHDIPRDPDLRYRKNWKNWEDWLTGDTNKIQGEWRNFNEARKYVRSLNISNTLDWKKYCKGELEGYSSRPSDIPAGPDHAYRNLGWINYADWLGTNNIRKSSNVEVWLSFEKAKKFVHNLNLKSYEDWKKYINGDFNLKRPDNIPKSPQFVYKNDGWTNWSDWLGTNIENLSDNVEEEYLPFEEARDFARSLNLYSPAEWRDYIEGFLDLPPIPNNIPKNPREVYKNNGWWGLYDWLGIEKK